MTKKRVSKKRMREIIASSREKWLSAFNIVDSYYYRVYGEDGMDLAAGDWWTHIGERPCSFCDEFNSVKCFKYRNSQCPLHPPGAFGCHPAWMRGSKERVFNNTTCRTSLPAHILFDTALEILKALDGIEANL